MQRFDTFAIYADGFVHRSLQDFGGHRHDPLPQNPDIPRFQLFMGIQLFARTACEMY